MKKKITVFVFAFIILLLGGELLSRYYLGLGDPPLTIQHGEIEYMFRPNQDVKRFGNRIKINEFGMRSAPFTRNKDENELRILLFGDSVLHGGSLTDQNDLASTIVENKLTSYVSEITVGNVSAGSWGPGNWLAYSKEYGFFDSDIIILLISSHDYYDIPTFEPLNQSTHPTHKPLSALAEGLTRYLPRYMPDVLRFGSEESKNKTQDITRDGSEEIENFLKLAQKNSRKLFVFKHWEESELSRKELNIGGNEILELCKKKNIEVVSMKHHYDKAMKNGINPYRDNIHLNAEGQKILASVIYKKVKNEIIN